MRLKSYFAGTVEAAIASASRELGDEAMLVYSREAAPEARYLGRHEVVFALPEETPATPPERGAGAAPDAGPRPEAADTSASAGSVLERLVAETAAIRRQVDRLLVGSERRPARPAAAAGWHWPGRCGAGPVEEVSATLLAAEVAPGDVADLLEVLRGCPDDDLWAALSREMAARLPVDGRLGEQAGGKRIVVLVGPPGAGKTSALVKLAARHALLTRRPAQLLSFDTFRILGAEQLRTYASILGAGFEAVETPGALDQALEQHRSRDLVLIDTAGYAEQDLENADDLARFLVRHPEADVHLTLSAGMKSADLTRVVDRFARFRPDKLLFTRLDETSTYGPLWSEAARRGKPLSFVSDGQRIPEDLREASQDELLRWIVGGQYGRRPEEPAREDRDVPPNREGNRVVAAA